MTGARELRVNRPAVPASVMPLRHVLMAFLATLDLTDDVCEDIGTAVGEALANAAEHAFDGSAPGSIELHARVDDGDLLVDVFDGGSFIERELRPNRGFGLRIIRAIARSVSIDTHGGTRVTMIFDTSRDGEKQATS